MKSLEIVKHPSEILRRTCTGRSNAPYIASFGLRMIKTMIQNNGCGLAAPQVGSDLDMFVMYINGRPEICYAPRIANRSETKSVAQEGCLSIPGVFVPVERPTEIEVEFYNHNAQPVQMTLSGLEARCFQHEYQHLQGILIIDYLPKKD